MEMRQELVQVYIRFKCPIMCNSVVVIDRSWIKEWVCSIERVKNEAVWWTSRIYDNLFLPPLSAPLSRSVISSLIHSRSVCLSAAVLCVRQWHQRNCSFDLTSINSIIVFKLNGTWSWSFAYPIPPPSVCLSTMASPDILIFIIWASSACAAF